MRYVRRSALAGALFSALTACSYYSKEDGERLKNETYALMTQVNAMQQAQTRLTESLDKMGKDVETLNKASRRNDADFGVQLDEAQQQVGRLRGLVESFQERLSTIESSTKKVQEELDLRFQKLQEQSQVEQLKSQTERQKAIEDAKQRDRLVADPTSMFSEVEKLIANGHPADARKILREFAIRAKSDKSLEKRLPDALYWVGETFFAEGNYQQAAAEYNGVRKNHPKSPKVPDALYRLGMCFEKLNLKDDAKLFYRTVIEKYGRSGVGKDAKARLDALK